MDNFECGGYIFNSNFDSGNLEKVELLRSFEDILPSENIVNVEFNAWTRPDCGGTEYENLNRSWFLFSIHGGEPHKVCKINVVNLNKQAKLFSQGMHPVTRIGDTGPFERMKESPTFFTDTDNFTLSFLHKGGAYPNRRHYYAFTFPFTYTDCQEQLNGFDRIHHKSAAQVNYIIQRLLMPMQASVGSRVENDDDDATTAGATRAAPVDLTACSHIELQSEIYYHRELLTHSLEGRNIDLLTITSFHGIQLEREERLPNLFPDTTTVRCNIFKHKKIIFISSRVHPGETPASFVLNGFLKLIFDKRSIVAATLRRLYVFKIVPFLNPDGVFNGFYRTDTLGHNLNRMYTCPSVETQPSIYSVRRLIRYYHHDKDVQEDADNSALQGNTLSARDNCITTTTNPSTIEANPNREGTVEQPFEAIRSIGALHFIKENIEPTIQHSRESSVGSLSSADSESSGMAGKSSSTSTSTLVLSPPAPPPPPSLQLQTHPVETVKASREDRSIGKVFHDKLMTEIKPIHTTGPVFAKKFITKKHNIDIIGGAVAVTRSVPDTKTELMKKKQSQLSGSGHKLGSVSDSMHNNNNKELQTRNRMGTIKAAGGHHRITKRRNTCNASASANNNNVSAPLTHHVGVTELPIADDSNIFVYIDLHGHASKKGIFMYGNFMPNAIEAVECMLLPRLMSMNCHHFHFDACVFSERNMYHKGKRDGLSKEGSGRVAIYKATGLIKCYTLEGNYNTGRYINPLPPRGKEGTSRKINALAPKYTPSVFEDVGRALGPSILDLTNSNPLSRIPNSEFKTLQGLRNSLRSEIDRSCTRSSFVASSSKDVSRMPKGKRAKSAAAVPCCTSLLPAEMVSAKENKGKNHHKQLSTTFGKKEGPSGRKKGKILCDVLPAVPATAAPMLPGPSKRPKVGKKTTMDSDSVAVCKKSHDAIQVEIAAGIQIGDTASVATAGGGGSSYFSAPNASSSTLGSEPCCSSSLCAQVGGVAAAVGSSFAAGKAKKLMSAATTTALVVAGGSQSGPTGTATATGKKLKLRSKFGGAGSTGITGYANGIDVGACSSGNVGGGGGLLLKPMKRSNTSKDSLRLKKKKTLKSDANCKRKKARVF